MERSTHFFICADSNDTKVRWGQEETEEGESDDDYTPPPTFDIHLRESLRIMADAIEFSRNPTEWVEIKTLTAQREPSRSEAVR